VKKEKKPKERGLRFIYNRGRQGRIKDKNYRLREVEAEPQKNLLTIWTITR